MSWRLGAPHMLALALPLLALVVIRARRLRRQHAPGRRRIIVGLLILSMLCGVLALARLEVGRALDRMAVIFVVDRSRSVTGVEGEEPWIERLRRAVSGMDAEDRAGLVVFGARAATEVAPSPRPSFGVARAAIPIDETDISAGLRRALSDLPADASARLVLVSDGVQTRGDALGAAALAAGRGVPIDVVPIEREPSPEIAVERVRLPPTADPGQPLELRVVTRASHAARVRVRVRRDGEPLASGEARIRAGADALTLRELAPRPGVHRYEVLLEPLQEGVDSTSANNEGGALVRVSGGSRALVLSDEPAEVRAFAEALRGAGMQVQTGDAARAPADLAELASYDLLVLADLGARALTEAQMEAVASYVRDLGGGLLMAGARRSMGLGGYAFTPVEGVLPATFDLRRRRDRASLAMVIAIDKSGSMSVPVRADTTKLDLANEAAARSAMLLSALDRVAVAHVDTEVQWTQPMTVVENPAAIAAVVRRAQPGGGGILVDPTLEASYRLLRDQPTQLKHLLLFSDGQDSEQMNEARRLVVAAAADRVTTSIVSMGVGPDTPELEHLSRLGGGRFYIVEDLEELPRIFTQETIAASRAALVTDPFRASVVQPSEATRGIDFDAAPALGGHAVVNARPRATILLAASEDEPLLLEHQHGVGRSAVFATDLGSALARPWLRWSGYQALFGQLGRALARSPERRDAQVHVSLAQGRGLVRVEAVDELGRTRNHLDLVATVAGPGGASEQVALGQTAAGRYEGQFAADAPGPYLVTVRERGQALVGSAGVVRPRGSELRGEGTDRRILAQIAAMSGGQVREDLEGLFAERPPPTVAFAPLWRELLVLAMLALLGSVAARRLVLRLPWRRAPVAEPAPVGEPAPLAEAGGRAHPGRAATRGPSAGEPRGDHREAAPSPAGARTRTPPAQQGETGGAPAAGLAAAGEVEAPAGGESPADEPSSLAETLLARKRRKR